MTVDLILLSRQEEPTVPGWSLGSIYVVKPDVRELNEFFRKRLSSTMADAWLFWDVDLGQLDPIAVQEALSKPAEIWHAGLLLGTQGLPGMIDFVNPTWMLNRDPPPGIEATSWRISLKACLVRLEVLRQMDFLDDGFESLDAAALEWGCRCIQRGVIIRHLPPLVGHKVEKYQTPVLLSFQDELRFIWSRFGRKWALWAGLRALLSRYRPPFVVLRSLVAGKGKDIPVDKALFRRKPANEGSNISADSKKVSVLIPTIERYAYLTTLLRQLREQTQPPYEVIIVDQTPQELRTDAPYGDFADLPLKVIYMDQAGQCSSRNAGLQVSKGDLILFIDDDDEIPPDLIAAHLKHLHQSKAKISCGVSLEDGLGDLPFDFTYERVSDVFPTNNSLIERSVLLNSGLFDLAYDHGSRADGDLGMRMYLQGSLMLLNPSIQALHHHAPRGGLRKHKARVITYGGSRRSIHQRHLPSVTDFYLVFRYFSRLQLKEELLISLLGTFSMHEGSRIERALKVLMSLMFLPSSLWTVFSRKQRARQLLQLFPRIPGLRQEDQIADDGQSQTERTCFESNYQMGEAAARAEQS